MESPKVGTLSGFFVWVIVGREALADEAGVALPTVALVRELLRMAMQRGFADQDFSALTEVTRL